MIIDTHAHVSSPDVRRYPTQYTLRGNSEMPTLGDYVRQIPVLPVEQFIAENDAAGIDATVVVQMYARYAYDNNYAADSVARYPDRLALVCTIDPTLPDAVDTLDYWITERGATGVRLLTSTHQGSPWLGDERTFGVWELARKRDITIIAQIFGELAPTLARVLQRFPDQRVALDHLGYPALDDGPPYAKAAPRFSLTACPNLTIKFSTDNIIAVAKGAGTQRAFFEQLIERFGPSRVMWSSNYNFIYSPGLAEQIATARSILSFLSPDETEQVFAGTALRHWPSLKEALIKSQKM